MEKFVIASLLLAFLLMLPFSSLRAQNDSLPPAPDEMGTYVLALLKAGPNRDQSEAEAAELQKGHMANINRLAQEGKLVIAGPCLDDSDLRGIFIFNVETVEEAQALVDSDPAIQAGRLVFELHPWYSKRGATLP